MTRHGLDRLFSARNALHATTDLHCPTRILPQAAVSNEISNIVLGIESTDFVEGLVKPAGRGHGR